MNCLSIYSEKNPLILTVYPDALQETQSPDFPTKNALFPNYSGASMDVFVTKINPTGTALVYSTYLGGNDSDSGNGISVDCYGNAYITGWTYSTNFPTKNAIFSNYSGGGDAFVAKINTSGTALIYSTYLGGNGWDSGQSIAVDSAGNAYVTGYEYSSDFPINNAFSTSLGGGGAFVTEINANGTALVSSSCLGSSGSWGNGIALDNSSNVYITGTTFASGFPLQNAIFPNYGGGPYCNSFVTKISGSSISGSTPASYYFGQTSESGYFAEPVNTALGNYTYKHTDLKMPGRGLAVEIARNYNSQDSYDGPLGYGWTYTYNMLLQIDSVGNVTVKYQDGHQEGYSANSDGTFTPNFGGIYNTLVKNADSTYTLTDKTQTRFNFTSAGQLSSITDKNGNVTSLTYTGTNLTGITGPAGKSLALSYDTNSHLTKITDPLGRNYTYAYDGNGNLASYTDPKGGVWSYAYDSSHEITQITDPDGNVLVQNVYTSGKVTSQTNGRGYTTTFQYDTPSSGITTITDPLGNVTVHTHDSNYRLTQEKDPLGHTISYSYDSNGNRIQVTDKNGNVTKYTYDSMGNVTSKIDASGNVTSITYDTNNNPLTRTDALGNTTSYAYDGNGNLVKMTDPLGNFSAYAYDGYGELIAKTDANGNATSFSYDAYGNLGQTKDALGDTVAYTYDAAGRKLSQTDPDGHTTTYAYDANDNPVSIKDALGNVQSFTYDADNDRTSFTDKNGNTTTTAYDTNDEPVLITDPLGGKTAIAYDALDRKISVTDPDGDTTAYSYDAVGNISSVTDPLGHVTSFTYDANGNKLTSSNPLGKTTRFAYDALSRLLSTTDPLGNVESKTYDALGRVISKTDPDGNVTRYQYDALGRLVKVIEADGGATSYAYDPVGNRTAFTSALGKTTSYAYDAVNRLVSETDPDGNVKQYGYDRAGNQTGLQKPDGAVIQYSFDALNRLSGIIYPKGAPTTFTYDPNGNRTGMTDALGTSSWAYDALNRMLCYSNPFGETVQYAYDAVGNRVKMIYPGNLPVSYAYDKAGHMLSVTDWLGNTTTYQYDATGDLVLISNQNGTTTTYSYDDSSRLIGLTNNKSDGSVISSYAYTLDGVGNQIAENRNEPLAPTILGTTTGSTFDGDNRIETAGTATFTHDANGNRTAQTGSNAATFTYDYANRLTSVSWGFDYGYDGLGNRLTQTQGTVETLFVLDVSSGLPNMIEATDAAGNAISYYVYGLGLVSKILPDGATYTYHFDSRGSTIAMTDASGRIVNEYAYTPFGELSGASGSVSNPFCYVGKYGIMEEGDGVLYMRARYYDSVTGRFLSKDPTEGDFSSPQTLDRYVYVLGNPVRFIDAEGLCAYDAEQSISQVSQHLSSDQLHNLYRNSDVTSFNEFVDQMAMNLAKEWMSDTSQDELKSFIGEEFVNYLGPAIGFGTNIYGTYRDIKKYPERSWEETGARLSMDFTVTAISGVASLIATPTIGAAIQVAYDSNRDQIQNAILYNKVTDVVGTGIYNVENAAGNASNAIYNAGQATRSGLQSAGQKIYDTGQSVRKVWDSIF